MDYLTGEVERTIDAPARALALSVDGKSLAGSIGGRSVSIWDVSTGQLVRVIEGMGDPLAYSPDGRYLVGYRIHEAAIEVLDAQTFEKIAAIHAPSPFTAALAISDDSSTLAAGDTNRTVWLYRLPRPERTRWLTLSGPARELVFAEERNRLAAGVAGALEVWDYQRERRIATIRVKSREPPTIDESRAGILASGGDQGIVQLWKLP